MRLSTRLFLIVLGCLGPIAGVEIYTQVDQYRERRAQVGAVALQEAELVRGELAGIVDEVRQIAAVIGTSPDIPPLSSACDDELASIARSQPAYRFLAVVAHEGNVVCASRPDLRSPASGWKPDLPAEPRQNIGISATLPGDAAPFLPVYLPLLPGQRKLVAALDLHWLSRHLQQVRLEHGSALVDAALILADERGTIIAGPRGSEASIGQVLPPELRRLAAQAAPGVLGVGDFDDRKQLAAVVGYRVPPIGLTAVAVLPHSALSDLSDAALRRHVMLITAAGLFALAFTWFIGSRFIARPTEALLAAARRWTEGDLNARVEIGERDGEFSVLARSFNSMAFTLASREQQFQARVDLLENQLVQRSRELSATNNRLQIESAERERTEAALPLAQRRQVVGQLAAGIAHESNNMLTTALGSLELLERHTETAVRQWTEPDVERMRRLIGHATHAGQQAAQLTSRLFGFSSRPRVGARPTDPNELIRDLLPLVSSMFGRRIKVVTELDEPRWPALIDPGQVEAAVLNLCLNASDAMPEGGALTIRTAHVTLTGPGTDSDPPAGPYVCIAVADTGTGMSAEDQQRAFQPFFTTKRDGTGLGLSQVQQVARHAGGAVRLRSTPGQGTDVTLLLPRAAAEPVATPLLLGQRTTQRTAPKIVIPWTVLVADDDPPVRLVIVEMLRDLGCETLQAGNSAEALALLSGRDTHPDMILLDYAMPGMNGLALARRLREDGLDLPIVMVTGHIEFGGLEAGERSIDGLLRKPFTVEELQALLSRLGHGIRQPSNVVRLHAPQRG